MQNHRVIATSWQIESARRGELKTVILPYADPIIRQGDQLYFAEKWWDSDDYGVFFESTSPDFESFWQPAETMPEKFALYWFEVTGFRESRFFEVIGWFEEPGLQRLGMLTFRDFEESGIHLSCPGVDYVEKERIAVWNEAYPDTPWEDSLWVRVLEVERLSEIPFKT